MARQVLAPKPRSLGKSAAEEPNDRLQADLIDFQPEHPEPQQVWAGGHGRVHTGGGHEGPARQAGGDSDPSGGGDYSRPGPGRRQLRRHHGSGQRVPGPGGGAARRRGAPPEGPQRSERDRGHRPRDPGQTLKKDLAGEVARHGGGWGDHVDEATEAYNARPHAAVTVAPEDVETMPAASFRVYQDNAEKFQHNKQLTEGRQRRRPAPSALPQMRRGASSHSTAPRGTWPLSTP